MTHPYWTRLSIAGHEAAHAVAAQWMGLKVAWVSIEDVRSEGEIYKAACGIDMENGGDDMNVLAVNADIPADKLLGVCVSMAMPSFTTVTTDPFYEYSIFEYRQALQLAEEGGIPDEEIDWRCEQIKDEKWTEICNLTTRLSQEGRIDFVPA
jgi:hypothetical protein